MKSIIYSILVIFLYACNSKNQDSFNKKTLQKNDAITNGKETDSLLRKAINDGNIVCYKKAASIYFNENRYNELYFYAMLMANKHNYSRAYYDLYIIINRKGQKINDIQMYSDDDFTHKLSIYFLLKSYELGLKEARSNLEEVFGENIPKSEIFLCDR